MQDCASGYLADADQRRQTGALRGRNGGGHKIGSDRLMFRVDNNKIKWRTGDVFYGSSAFELGEGAVGGNPLRFLVG